MRRIIFVSQIKDLFGINAAGRRAGRFWRSSPSALRSDREPTAFRAAMGSDRRHRRPQALAADGAGHADRVAPAALATLRPSPAGRDDRTRFGGLPSACPAPALPVITWERVLDRSCTDASSSRSLGGIESLTLYPLRPEGRRRHKSGERRHRSTWSSWRRGSRTSARPRSSRLCVTRPTIATNRHQRPCGRKSGRQRASCTPSSCSASLVARRAGFAAHIPLACAGPAVLRVVFRASGTVAERHRVSRAIPAAGSRAEAGGAARDLPTFVVSADLTVGHPVGGRARRLRSSCTAIGDAVDRRGRGRARRTAGPRTGARRGW